MSQAPEDSPNELTPAPHVRRLNRVPLLIAGLLLSVLLAAVAYSYYARLAKTSGKPEEAQKPEPAPVLLKDAPDAGFIPREKEPPRPAVAPLPKEPVAPPEPQDEARKLAWESYRQKLERRRALREEATLQAVLANTNAWDLQVQSRRLRQRKSPNLSRNPSASPILRSACAAWMVSRPKTAISIAPARSATS